MTQDWQTFIRNHVENDFFPSLAHAVEKVLAEAPDEPFTREGELFRRLRPAAANRGVYRDSAHLGGLSLPAFDENDAAFAKQRVFLEVLEPVLALAERHFVQGVATAHSFEPSTYQPKYGTAIFRNWYGSDYTEHISWELWFAIIAWIHREALALRTRTAVGTAYSLRSTERTKATEDYASQIGGQQIRPLLRRLLYDEKILRDNSDTNLCKAMLKLAVVASFTRPEKLYTNDGGAYNKDTKEDLYIYQAYMAAHLVWMQSLTNFGNTCGIEMIRHKDHRSHFLRQQALADQIIKDLLEASS